MEEREKGGEVYMYCQHRVVVGSRKTRDELAERVGPPKAAVSVFFFPILPLLTQLN